MGSNASLARIYGAQTNAHVLKHMDNIQMVVINNDAGQHPCELCSLPRAFVRGRDSTLTLPSGRL